MPLPAEQLLRGYQTMRLIRGFEESIRKLHGKGHLPGFMHVSVGQEAVPTGVSLALREDDLITAPHRNHGDVIAKGVPVEGMFAEVYGHVGGTCRGKGGSLHIASLAHGVLGANGIVGAGLPIAVGAALAVKRGARGPGGVGEGAADRVVVAYAGDGAIATGASHEALNMAALWKVPVVFVREDNQYAESTPHSAYQAMPDIVQYVEGYGIPAEAVDGNDLEAVADAAERAVARARAGGGPGFLQCATYRWYGHNIGDTGAYRPPEEVTAWKARDPIERVRRLLLERGGATADELDAVDAAVAGRIEEGIAWAAAQPEPPPGWAREDVFTDQQFARLADWSAVDPGGSRAAGEGAAR